MLYNIKYAPQNSSQIIGQQIALAQLKDFILNYKKQKNKSALLTGPIGNGKTSSVYALAKELNYDLLEINSSDLRNEAEMKSFLNSALGQTSLFFKPKLILVDEIDNVSGQRDRGAIPALCKAIEKSSYPVILTANELEDSKFKPLIKSSYNIQYQKLEYKIVAEVLRSICQKENLAFEEKALNSLARKADGDLRAALIDLQICAEKGKIEFNDVNNLSDRKRTESILNALMLIFKSSSAENALHALENTDLEPNEIFLWIDENLPKEYLTPKSLAKAYEHLARADVFNGRIKRQQHWRFLAYLNDLLTAGISSAKEERNTNSIEYKPTMRILRIWQSNMKNAKRKEIAEKLAKHTHTSTKVALQQIPYFQNIFKKNSATEIAKELELNEEEIDWLKK